MVILIDQDNVLADFDGAFIEEWRKQFPNEIYVPFENRREFYVHKDYPLELKDKIGSIYTAPGFIYNLPTVSGSLGAVSQLVDLGHDIRICSSPLSSYKNCVEEKYAWVEKHFGKDFIKRVVLAKDKTLIKGDLLIDDKPEVTGSLVPEWEHIIFDRPWNRAVTGRRRLSWKDWKETLKMA